MADIASRPSKANAMFCSEGPVLSDPELISSFNTTFPLPNQQEWQLAMVPPWLKLNVFETLRGRRLDLRQWTGLSGTGTGSCGSGIAGFSQAAVKCQKSCPTMSRTCSSLLLSPCGKVSTALAVRSKFSQLLSLSMLLPKNMFWMDMLTPDGRPQLNTP
jgi:hypothetical protein